MLASCKFTPRNKALELHAGTKNGGCLTNLTEALSGSSFLFISVICPPRFALAGFLSLFALVAFFHVGISLVFPPAVFRRGIRALTHMWNGPVGKVFVSQIAVGRCGHMSGLSDAVLDRWPR